MAASPSLIAELEDAIQSGSPEKRVDTLRRLTDLFVADAERFTDRQIGVFDDVLGHLIGRIEDKALAELSRRLAPINHAPTDVVRRLSRHDNIAVAAPILTQSRRLNDADLIDIANTQTQAHLLAISARSAIAENVTDALLRRGDRSVFHQLAENAGATFSASGFATLVKQSAQDEQLAEKVGLRLDVPLRLFQVLLLHATEAVRSRLLALAGPESRDRIQRVVRAVSDDAQHEAIVQSDHANAEAQAQVVALRANGELNEAVVLAFAKERRYAETVAALADLCAAPVQLVGDLVQNPNREAILVPCKAAALGWSTVRAILACRPVSATLSDLDIDHAQKDYRRLSQAGAQRVLRFWQVRQAASKDTAAPRTPLPRSVSAQSHGFLSGRSADRDA